MKTSSAKAKGRMAQQLVRDALLGHAPGLTPNDVRSTSMGASGVDILMSEAALTAYPLAIEVKCQESLNIWSALAQAELQRKPGIAPVLCFKRNRTEMFIAMKFEDFLALKTKT